MRKKRYAHIAYCILGMFAVLSICGCRVGGEEENFSVGELTKKIYANSAFGQGGRVEEVIPCPKASTNKYIVTISAGKIWGPNVYMIEYYNDEIQSVKILNKSNCVSDVDIIKPEGFDDYWVVFYEASNQGNGGLRMYSFAQDMQELYFSNVYDMHRENRENIDSKAFAGINSGKLYSFIYDGGCLNVEYKDMNGDGISDFVFSGTQLLLDEKEEIVDKDECRFVYIYDAKNNTIKLDEMQSVFPRYWEHNIMKIK